MMVKVNTQLPGWTTWYKDIHMLALMPPPQQTDRQERRKKTNKQTKTKKKGKKDWQGYF